MVDDVSLLHLLYLVVYLPLLFGAVPFMVIELSFGPIHGPFLVLIGFVVVVANPWISDSNKTKKTVSGV